MQENEISSAWTTTDTFKGFSASTLKIIAIVAMLIDHIGAVVVDHYLNSSGAYALMAQGDASLWKGQFGTIYAIYNILRFIGRLGFPMFTFLLVEGFMHTRSRLKYAIRLGAFALISEIPFNYAIAGKMFAPNYQNVFFTLFLGFLFMCFAEYVKEKEIKTWMGVVSLIAGSIFASIKCVGVVKEAAGILGADITRLRHIILTAIFTILIAIIVVVIIKLFDMGNLWTLATQFLGLMALCWMATFLKTDYAASGVLAIAAMYAFKENKFRSMLAGVIVLTVLNPVEVFAFCNLIFVGKYNGQKGIKLNKYFFYAFYPCHLFILYLIAVLLGFTTFGGGF